MKKVLRYASITAAAVGSLALVSAILSERQETKLRRQVAAQDEMLLPSESQRLMRLADTLSASQRNALFRRYNLASLFRLSAHYPTAQNGFIGSTPQRLEVVFKEAVPDARHPGTYHVAGLTRVKKAIQALQGTIALQQVRYAWDRTSETYTATGVFKFVQAACPSQSVTTWQGVAAIDFEVEKGQPKLFEVEGAMLPISRGFAFEGTRSATAIANSQRVIWANDFGPLGSAILKDFGPGGRSQEVDPRYHKYGWADYWQNDEWWADSPRPKLNL